MRGYKTYTQYIYIAVAVAVTNTQTSQTHKHVCCTQEITHVEAVPPHKAFRDPKALVCSVPSEARVLLRS